MDRYKNYNESAYYWEMVIMLRKAGVAMITVLVSHPVHQVTAAIALLVVSLCAHLVKRPFRNPSISRLEDLQLSANLFTMFVALLLLSEQLGHGELPAAELDDGTHWAFTVLLFLVNGGVMVITLYRFLRELFTNKLYKGVANDVGSMARRAGCRRCCCAGCCGVGMCVCRRPARRSVTHVTPRGAVAPEHVNGTSEGSNV